MASEKQTAANRRNARKSSGPKTPDGKARSAQNATRHGLLAREAVLPEEDRQAYLDLLAELRAQFLPADPVEEFLLRDMVSAQWRLLRLTRIETGYFTVRMEHMRKLEYGEEADEPANSHDEQTRLFGHLLARSSSDPLATLARHENSLRRAFYKALAAFQKRREQNEPNSPGTTPGSRPAEPPAPAPDPAPATSAPEPAPQSRALFLLKPPPTAPVRFPSPSRLATALALEPDQPLNIPKRPALILLPNQPPTPSKPPAALAVLPAPLERPAALTLLPNPPKPPASHAVLPASPKRPAAFALRPN
jgi:hypothetical protein